MSKFIYKYRHLLSNSITNQIKKFQILIVHFSRKTNTYPNLLKLVQIALVLPVTSCEAERTFSTLRRLLTWLRSRMKVERLSNLARMHVHRAMTLDISPKYILKEFVASRPRVLEYKIVEGQIIIRYTTRLNERFTLMLILSIKIGFSLFSFYGSNFLSIFYWEIKEKITYN